MEDTLEQTIRKMKAGDACICGSDQTWKQCCGRLMDNLEEFAGHMKVTAETPIRFFLGDMLHGEGIHSDDEGRSFVFVTRAPAMALNQRLGNKYQIIGMGEAKWTLFQADFPNLLVISDADA